MEAWQIMNHACIVPLIGGIVIGSEAAFGTKPKYLLSYSPFKNNDRHLVEYYGGKVPYGLIDEGFQFKLSEVDAVSTTCPCAGLSSLSPGSKADSATNDWMVKTAKYVLEEVQPKVFWGENAPRLASKMGEPTVKKLRKIATDNGYTFMIYKTKSILHGLSQVRDRTFYFFFKGDVIPKFPFIQRPHKKIEDAIREVKFREDDPMKVLVSERRPSKDDPFYRFVLQKMHNGWTHQRFQKEISKSINPMDYIENAGISYREVAEWFREKELPEKLVKRCLTIDKKLKAGGNIMRKVTEIPKDYIGAFVGHYPSHLTHPDHDRYLTIRECLSLMGLPNDFILQGGVRNLNHICQNVPVTTATDMAQAVKDHLEGKLETMTVSFAIIDNKAQHIESEYSPESLDKFLA